MLSRGDQAPDFQLPGTDAEEIEEYQLSEHREDSVVVLTFYLFDFHPECTDALCSVRDAEWLTLEDDVQVFGIGTDRVFSHREFAAERGFKFPLLSDSDGKVSEAYGVLHDEVNGHKRVSKRAAFVVDSSGTVQYSWSSDDPQARPDLQEVAEAAREATLDAT